MLTFRKADVSDTDSIAAVENECFEKPYSRQMIQRDLQLPFAVYFVAQDGGQVVGYGGFWQVADECHIISIAVCERYRLQGVGSSLLCQIRAEAEKMGLVMMLLEVRKSNAAARRLYEKHGFTQCGIRKKYYENDEDALLMNASLLKEGLQ
ncbi:MAG: ribosomal protein S18-alanine N-acetyltransferase [Clostridia bacterium]|nr:ribosomal protein S18-alanine N-acetyltransferase [Clostridia bacterium]